MRQHGEALQRIHCQFDAFRIQSAGTVDTAPKTAKHFLVEYRNRHSPRRVKDDKTHRIRADIDHGNRLFLRLGVQRTAPRNNTWHVVSSYTLECSDRMAGIFQPLSSIIRPANLLVRF